MRLEFKATEVGNVPTFITQGELNMVRGAEDQADRWMMVTTVLNEVGQPSKSKSQ